MPRAGAEQEARHKRGEMVLQHNPATTWQGVTAPAKPRSSPARPRDGARMQCHVVGCAVRARTMVHHLRKPPVTSRREWHFTGMGRRVNCVSARKLKYWRRPAASRREEKDGRERNQDENATERERDGMAALASPTRRRRRRSLGKEECFVQCRPVSCSRRSCSNRAHTSAEASRR